MSSGYRSRKTGELSPAGERLLALSRLPIGEIAAQLDISPASVRTSLSVLRRDGYDVPTRGKAKYEHSRLLSVYVTAAVSDELVAQARLRWPGNKSMSPIDIVETLLAIVHRDNLYDAILGAPPKGKSA